MGSKQTFGPLQVSLYIYYSFFLTKYTFIFVFIDTTFDDDERQGNRVEEWGPNECLGPTSYVYIYILSN